MVSRAETLLRPAAWPYFYLSSTKCYMS